MNKFFLLTSLLPLSFLLGTTATWNSNVSGNWGTAANWNPATVPNAQGDSAIFPNMPALSVTLDISPTIGSLTLNSTSSYQILSSGSTFLTFSISSGSASITVPNTNTAAQTISAPLTLTSNLLITQNSAAALTLGGVASGGASMTVAGTGTVVLTATNAFSGGLIISGGVVQCGGATVLPLASSVTMSGGILNLNNFAQTIGGLSGTSNVTLGSAALTIMTTGASSYGGQISGTGSVTVGGTGSLTLTAANSYNGGTVVSGGSLILGVNNALNTTGTLTVNTPGVFNLNNFSQTVSLLAGNGSVALGSGVLTIQGANPAVFSGAISGLGSVVQNGSATITFSGANTYGGGTVINGGILQLGASQALPSGGAVAVNGGTFDLHNFSQTVGNLTGAGNVTLGTGQLTVILTSSANFSGVISGGGSVVFQGPFSWTFLTPQTYTGGTTINAGILQMGVPNGLASAAPVAVNFPGTLSLNNNPLAIGSLVGGGVVSLGTGNLTLNTSTTTVFPGQIVGGGQLIVQGTGTQVLTGMNSYSGGTTVSGGATLQGTTSSLQGAIANNGTLFFNQVFAGSYGGPLSGTGVLQVGGGGVLTLSGSPSQSSVSVVGAQLDIAAGSNLTAPTVSIGGGSTLGGGGMITGSVNTAGTINPDPVLTVTGNVTFQPGSTFIADLTPTTSDQLAVSGIVTIQSGSQVVISAARGNYEAETTYPIITSAGGAVVGQFQSFVQSNPFLDIEFIYNRLLPGSVEIDLTITPFFEIIHSGNAGAISKCITFQNLRSDHDLEQLIADLIFLTVDEVKSILEEMQPSELRALTVAEQNNALFAQQAISWRMAEFDRTECEWEASRCHPWNVWASLGGNWTDQRPADHQVGYHSPALAAVLGFDGKIAENLYLGIGVEYGYAELTWRENRGSSRTNRVSAGPYLSWAGRYGYLNGTAWGSYAHFDTTRQIPFFGRKALSTHGGQSLLAHLDGGIVLHPAPRVSLTPFAAIDYIRGWEQAFQERGAESLNFSIASSISSFIRTEVGLKISKCAVRSHGKWVHDLKASWVYENRYHGHDLSATFRQVPCGFTVQGLYPSRSLLDVGMGLTFLFKEDRFAATLRYEGQFGEAITLQSSIAQLLIRF